jgi:hypothetical protein
VDESTLAALKGSIAKWEAIVAGTGTDDGANNCPLCQKFSHWCNPELPKRCVGCPVSEKMEMPYCEGTPYYEYSQAEEDDEPERMKEAAQGEVEFLKSLLPTPSDEGEQRPNCDMSQLDK